jgi:hypothetical protein
LTIDDVDRAGGKGANLGELVSAGLPVPQGFVVTAQAYLEAMDVGGVRADLVDRVSTADADDSSLARVSADLQDLVHKAAMPNPLRRELVDAYQRLGGEPYVAVRSSATGEDSAAASFAGMNETFTNVRGEEELARRVVDCWASLFGARACAYRASQGVTAEPAIAVVVQRMINSERSGVMFTADPATGDRSHVVIEAAFGLGEVVVGGQIEPDTYVVDKDGPSIVETRIGVQAVEIVRGDDGHDRRVELDPQRGARAVLTDEEVRGLALLGRRVENPLRSTSGHGMGDRERDGVSRAVAADHDARSRGGRDGRDRSRGARARARHRVGRGARPGGWERASAAFADPGSAARERRDPRRADDQPRLGAGDPARRRARDRQRRHHLPRGDRQPGAGRAVHRRLSARDRAAPRRHGRDGRRYPRRGLRG